MSLEQSLKSFWMNLALPKCLWPRFLVIAMGYGPLGRSIDWRNVCAKILWFAISIYVKKKKKKASTAASKVDFTCSNGLHTALCLLLPFKISTRQSFQLLRLQTEWIAPHICNYGASNPLGVCFVKAHWGGVRL